jgi:hypothetical protein
VTLLLALSIRQAHGAPRSATTSDAAGSAYQSRFPQANDVEAIRILDMQMPASCHTMLSGLAAGTNHR